MAEIHRTISEQAFWASKEQTAEYLHGPATLAGIVEFSIKSGRPRFVDRAFVDNVGLRDTEDAPFSDRQFMMTNSKGKMESQRSLPTLALLELTANGKHVTLTFHRDEGDEELTEGFVREKRVFEFDVVQVADDEHEAVGAKVHTTDGIMCIKQGKEVDAWLSQCLGKEVQLVWQQDENPRKRGEVFSGLEDVEHVLRCADSSSHTALSFHVLNMLNERLAQEHSDWYFEPISFRMNMLFAGKINEHQVVGKCIKVGSVYFYVWRPKVRCEMPTKNQKTGKARGKSAKIRESLAYVYQKKLTQMHDVLNIPEVNRTSQSKRPDGQPIPNASLGVDLVPLNKGYISVGDAIEVVEIADLPPELFAD